MMEGFFRFTFLYIIKLYNDTIYNSITSFYFQTHLCRIISQRNRSYRHYKKNGKSRGASTEKLDSKRLRVEMKNINVTKKGILHEEDFKSMLIQLRAEYAKAVPDRQFIVELLEKTRNNRAIWNKEKLERVLYDIIERVPCLNTDIYVSYHLLGVKIYT